MNPGPAALAELFRQVLAAAAGDEDPAAEAERLWPAFRAAVAAAMNELREEEVRGIQRWRAERHGGTGEAGG